MQTPIQIVNRYKFGLISWDDMQNDLKAIGYKMTEPAHGKSSYLMPIKSKVQNANTRL